ncbi:MAG: Ig-like domain-containing protein, partial [Taibaiella sp.]|nr:Ig-like domain-containing protein [Taibaiella sp.]
TTSCGTAYATYGITVLALPSGGTITGLNTLCVTSSITLTDTSGGGSGTWTTSNSSVASVNSSGTVTGTGTGTAIITYTVTNSCGSDADTMLVTVTLTPSVSPITGARSVCVGENITLADATPGGTWAASNTNASITSGGVVTGVAPGADTITYNITNSCGSASATEVVTVNPMPAPTTGAATFCQGVARLRLGDTPTGGTWSASTTAVATVSGSGIVYNTGAGTTIISYTLSTGCGVAVSITANPLPAAITGSSTVCLGSTTTLSNATGTGTWSTSNGSVASIDGSGNVTGVALGTATITYTLGTGCYITTPISVNSVPPAITGATNVCVGSGIALNNTSTGGTWTSSNTATATVNAGSGVVMGVSGGTVTITYTNGGCYSTHGITVDPLPAAITGITSVCDGSSTTLSNATTGGSWSSTNTGIATVSSGGVVTGVSPGTATISYTSGAGCSVSVPVTVNAIPAAITGTTQVCLGTGTTLSNTTAGGTWSSSNGAVASVNALGFVTGVSAGTVTITYTVAGCYTTTSFTVVPLPGSTIMAMGDTTMCPGDFVVLTAATGTGFLYQWYTGASIITGATDDYYLTYAPGNYRVSVTNSIGCTSISVPTAVTVNPSTASVTVTGATTFCSGNSVSLSANTGAGLSYQWILGSTGISGATTSTLAAGASGSYHVVVTNAAGCSASSSSVAVTAVPVPDNTLTITGSLTFCAGASVGLSVVMATGVNYQWQDAGVDIPGATSTSYSPTTTGNYRAILTNSYPCSSTTAVANATAVALPAAAIAVSGATVFCTGGAVGLSTAAGAGNTYQWYLNGSAISGATTSTYTAGTGGDYTVRVTTPLGCTNTTPVPVTLSEMTTPLIIPRSTVNHCWGGATLLSASTSATTGITFQWQFNGVDIPGATGNTLSAAHTGYYSCVITLTAGGCSAASAWFYIIEFPLPNPVVVFDGTYLKTANYYSSYQWSRNSVAIAGANTNMVIPFGTADYTVTVMDTNGCQSVSTGYPFPNGDTVHTDTTGTGTGGGGTGGGTTAVSNQHRTEINIYPNPARDKINITSAEALRLVISAVDGRRVMEIKDAKEVNISSLASGVYTLMLFNAEGQMLKAEKLIKE